MKHPCIKTYTTKGNRRFNASFKNNKQGELMTHMDEPCDRIKKNIKTHETGMLKLLPPKGNRRFNASFKNNKQGELMTNSEQHVTNEK